MKLVLVILLFVKETVSVVGVYLDVAANETINGGIVIVLTSC